MEALRQIIVVKNKSLKIKLPENFNADMVEVIILPFKEKFKKRNFAGLRGKLNLSEAEYKDFQENVKNSRKEWEKNI